jgi:putative hydrolase of the HAD superfamily
MTTVFTDADNTLWDTDGLFARAQLELLDCVEGAVGIALKGNRLDFVREIDQALAEQHHQGLRYPMKLLVIAVAYALQGEAVGRAAQRAWREVGLPAGLNPAGVSQIEDRFVAEVRGFPAALPGVVDGMRRLEKAGAKTYVVSEGDRTKVAARLEHIGLPNLALQIIEAPKSADLFRRVGKLGGDTAPSWMIGDQLTRDIQPAQDAGLKTIYIPSRFRPKWEVAAPGIQPDYTVSDFSEAVARVLA